MVRPESATRARAPGGGILALAPDADDAVVRQDGDGEVGVDEHAAVVPEHQHAFTNFANKITGNGDIGFRYALN